MSNVSVDEITIKLTPSEAITVGQALKDRLVKTKSDGYDIEKNYPGMLQLTKQILNTAYGYDYGRQIDLELSRAKED